MTIKQKLLNQLKLERLSLTVHKRMVDRGKISVGTESEKLAKYETVSKDLKGRLEFIDKQINFLEDEYKEDE